MTISATTQGLRPGVCTSTSRPSSPFDGMVIYETDTNRVLIWDNSAWVMIADTDSPPGLQLVKTQTIGTAVSTVVVSDVFSADYDNYLILISDGVGSGSTSSNLTLGSTTTGYYYSANWLTYATTPTTVNVGGANATSFAECIFQSSNAINCQIVLKNPFLAKRTFANWQVSGAATAGVNLAGQGGGFLDNNTSYTAFTLTTTSGTLTGGNIRVYGYRNS